MAVTTYSEWVQDGSPWRNAPYLLALKALFIHYDFQFETIGDLRHLTANPPEDHTPFSHTAWPRQQPYPVILAADIVATNRTKADWRRVGEQIVDDKRVGIVGTGPIKYVNWTDMSGQCWHSSWEPTYDRRPSTDRGHIHISLRSDLFRTSSLRGWDPVAKILGTTPVKLPAAQEGLFVDWQTISRTQTTQTQTRIVQGLLIAWRYSVGSPNGLPDGDWGPVTDQSVRRFQADHHVPNSVRTDGTGDGQVGPRTIAALNGI